jgi:acetyl esterase/lipase
LRDRGEGARKRDVTALTTPVPYDPELQLAVGEYLSHAPTLTLDAIPFARELHASSQSEPDLREGRIEREEHTAPGPDGGPPLALTVFRPAGHDDPLPGIYFIHAGGMIVGDRFTGINAVLDWVDELKVVVVTVEYRLSPESPHPTPVEDCYAGLIWSAEHSSGLGIDLERLLVVGGSAGGGLAAAVAILARDRHGPRIRAQMLNCPMLDDRNRSVSSHQYVGVGVWDRLNNEVGWTALLGDARGGADVSPYAAPGRLDDFSGLPEAYVDVGSAEIFRDEAVAYAGRLWEAGVQADLHVWAGGFHGFTGRVPSAQISRQAVAAQRGWLKRVLGL